MFESLALCFAFHCSASLNITKRTLALTDRDRLYCAIRVHLRQRGRLLKILNLLADLLQFALAADDALGDCSIIRFRSECVEFAKNLLRNEFQCSPNRLFAAQMMGKLSKVTLKARQLF